MTLHLGITPRKAAIDAILSPAAGGNGPDSGTLVIYSGAAPVDADTALSGNTELAQVPLPADAFPAAGGTASNPASSALAGVPLTEASADATGTATFFRLLASGGACVLQGSVTATGGGGDMTLDTTSLNAGVQFQVTALTFTWPA